MTGDERSTRVMRTPPAGGQSLLFTPAEAAQRMKIKESWLRRTAGERRVPCTFLGKHLRFSEDDLVAIVRDGATAQPRHRHRARQRPPASQSRRSWTSS
ncbi:helix-turn-helix domain-containing protein [Amycolatopsis sp. NPDC051903]|uniref:helix-turn-helix domain-containing protein n=1 Tax=Amycolatopsis sp. NPDC051903 TaxID=3363936 RepID=UPI00379E3AEF